MCGRYTFIPGDDFYEHYNVSKKLKNLTVSYNVAPGQQIPIITRNSPNKLVIAKWGLIPFWAKDSSIGYKMINARSETLTQKASFRKPLYSQRCLVPASGFFEWKKTDEKRKIPYYIQMKNKDMFSMAGLYDIWTDAEGEKILSYTIITTDSNTILQPIHNRMPVIVKRDNEDKWLDKNTKIEDVLKLLKPIKSSFLNLYTVGIEVNKIDNNSKNNIKKIKHTSIHQDLLFE